MFLRTIANMVKLAPTVRLNSGYEMPVLGLGTWKGDVLPDKVSKDGEQRTTGEVEQAVRDAIDAGYRHIDCALLYENEEEIGDAINAKIKEGVVKREDLFVTSKLWNTAHRPDLVEPACRLSLKKLQLDYLDLYLVHWPTAFKEGEKYTPTDENGKTLFSNVDIIDTWKAVEQLVSKGLTKSVGVSNYNHEQLTRTIKNAKIVPAVNQVECSPYFQQKKLREFCKQHNITVCGYSPFGSPNRPWADWEKEKFILKDPVLIEIGKKYNKTSAQVALRYLVKIGVVPLPKSGQKNRIISNFDIFDFDFTPAEMKQLEELANYNQRAIPYLDAYGHPEYPFNIEY